VLREHLEVSMSSTVVSPGSAHGLPGIFLKIRVSSIHSFGRRSGAWRNGVAEMKALPVRMLGISAC
jgi:hypothetical protein